MRLQLLLSFALVIALVLGTGWFLAIRATDARFAILVSETNQQQAQLLAPSILSAYEAVGSWEEVQTTLTSQISQQGALSEALSENGIPYPNNSVTSFELGAEFPNLGIEVYMHYPGEGSPLHPESDSQQAYLLNQQPPNRPTQNQALVLEPPDLSWLVSNMILYGQRVLVADTNGHIVVDTGSELVGEKVDSAFIQRGIPLYDSNGHIGTFVLTSRNGVYTFKQTTFLQQVRQGLIYAGAISAAIALILALILAYQITRPLRSLTAAAAHIQAGEWGYQVDFQSANEIGQLATAFNAMSVHLAEQRRLRARLVDDLAHELNTPLSLMRLELQGMSDGFQTPAEAAEHLAQELTEVSDLVADLIFLANRDTAPAPQMISVDLNQIAQNALRRFESTAGANKQLIFEPSADLPLINADPYLLQRAISNLISNALRHTPAGGKVTVSTLSTARQIQLKVTDTGEGIPAEHLPHIFDRLYRVDSARDRHSGGRGLGLAIVQQIMEQHQGVATVTSEVSSGSTFTLIFPLPQPGTF